MTRSRKLTDSVNRSIDSMAIIIWIDSMNKWIDSINKSIESMNKTMYSMN